jgi:protein TonB
LFTVISGLALAGASAGAATHSKAPQARGAIEGVFTADDYPAEALDKNEQGAVHTLIRVGKTGAITDCIVEKTSGSPLLDKRTCDIIRERAKLQAARDWKGRRVASELHKTITWRIAQTSAPSDPWSSRIVTDFGPYGDAVACRIELQMPGQENRSAASPHRDCPAAEMKKYVAGELRFGGPIDRMSQVQQFAIGPAPPPTLGPNEFIYSRLVLGLEVDAGGKLTSCKVIERVAPPLPLDPCLAAPKEYRPRTAASGKPAPFSATQAFMVIVHIDRTRPPKPAPLSGSLQGLISPEDYPPQALDRNEQGTVGAVLSIDAAGSVGVCRVDESSGSEVLDAQTCRLLSLRAKFAPARDQQGKAIASEYHTRIKWQIGEDRVPSEPWSTRLVITMGSNGRQAFCRFEADGAMSPAPGQKPPSCEEVSPLPFPALTALPPMATSVIFEQRFQPEPKVRPEHASGDRPVARQIVALQISAVGKVISCKSIEESGDVAWSDPCPDIAAETFDPLRDPAAQNTGFAATITYSLYVHSAELPNVPPT